MSEAQDQMYRDPDQLREDYHQKELNLREMAEKYGCSLSTVSDWMNNHGIEARPHPQILINHEGYEYFQDKKNGDRKRIKHHRLLAVAEYGIKAVKDNDVHHKNGIRWLNYPENLEVMSHDEHMRMHQLQ